MPQLQNEMQPISKAAYAHRNSNGNVFDEWVCNFQGTVPIHQLRQTGEGLTPSPICSVICQKYSQKSQNCPKSFSQLFYGNVYAELYRHFGASLHISTIERDSN